MQPILEFTDEIRSFFHNFWEIYPMLSTALLVLFLLVIFGGMVYFWIKNILKLIREVSTLNITVKTVLRVPAAFFFVPGVIMGML